MSERTCARRSYRCLWALTAGLLCGFGGAAAAQTPAGGNAAAQPTVEETVTVVGATPLHGLGIDRHHVPANVQAATAETLGRTGGASVAEQLNLALGSVHLNEANTNPFQPDLQFRGFTASPLLGLPQGLAVYQNGVRLNEPFGDTVNWDLLPANAIAGINLVPGSNPLFGLNALGGAVSIQTKTGFSHPGHGIDISAGSFGRATVAGATGGHRGRLGYFIAGTALAEEGWRDFSPSRVRQLHGDVEYRHSSATTLNATVTSAFNRLIGNSPAPVDLLEENRSAVFTHPDETKTRMTLLTLRGRHVRGASLALEGTLFFRGASIRTFNGDDSAYDECEDEAFEEFLCSDEGEGDPVESQLGGLIPVDDEDEFDATNNTSWTRTNGWGGAVQLSSARRLGGRDNHFVTGLTFDAGGSRYEADTEIARLTQTRGTEGVGLFDEDAAVRLRTTVRHTGIYAADFFTVAPRVTLMGAARFNYSTVTLDDRAGTALDGEHEFTSVNPAVGVTYEWAPEATVYGSFSMASRVPAPSELSCADPEDPCRLPNAFVADPPLEQVLARTWEAGIRGVGPRLAWNATVFRTANQDDIMFISSGPLTNTGHFENVGDTLRQGIELGASGSAGPARWTLAYSWLRARFGTPLTLSSPNHPDEENGEIEVEAGDTLPGIPQHNVKAGISTVVRNLTIGGQLLLTSRQYLRGDEANRLPALEGFSVVNLTGSYRISDQVRLTGRVTNLLGREYATFGLLGEPDEVLGDDYDDPRFVSPGAPRAAWAGIEISLR